MKAYINNARKTKSEVCGITVAAFHTDYNSWLRSG